MQITKKFEDVELIMGDTVVAFVEGTATFLIDEDFVECLHVTVESVYRNKPGYVIPRPSPLMQGRDAALFWDIEDKFKWKHAEFVAEAAASRADGKADYKRAMAS